MRHLKLISLELFFLGKQLINFNGGLRCDHLQAA